ncbi:Integrase [Andreprevotia lacus DSM 23236]|uniref:Integrase n=1 Tax=Andreprevotia lacus DSM 23236 TaxID=1121001 RepID=A0A1W1X3M3_9NEIS|nr:tyrosine-type recombinase/integrase [Andreprevotia lacus]SMC18011.1 Integrase [Andreprevotia lacus DSM 23236]
MPLTELQCAKAKVTGDEYQLADGNGLSLVVRAKGTKAWRYEFRLGGKKQKHLYGNYPEISLGEARAIHAIARKLIELGQHPAELLDNEAARRLALAGASLDAIQAAAAQTEAAAAASARMTFGEAAARYKTEWVDHNWKSPDKGFTPARVHLLPALGDLALDDINAPLLRELFYDIRERRGPQAALHSHGWAARIFGYALEHEWCSANPAQQIKAARIGTKGKRSRWLTLPELRRYLIGLYQADCYRGYKLALHLLLILALRKNELCGANWQEFDFEAGEWLIPASRMKAAKEHRVFLPKQALEILDELKRLANGSDWVLPMPTNPKRAMNGNNLDGAHAAAINAAKIEDYVIHDHRHTISTQLREQGHLPEVVEAALSHAIPGIAGVYAHAQYKQQRLAMLQAWADFLDSTMNEQTVIAATFRKLA